MEVVSLGVILVVGGDRKALMTVEAMVKYYVVSSLSSGVFLLGVLVFY